MSTDNNDKKAKVQAALAANRFSRQLWFPPTLTPEQALHYEPLLEDYGTLLIYLCRVHEDANTTSIVTFSGRPRGKTSPSEVSGDYSLPLIAQQVTRAIIFEKTRQASSGLKPVACISIDDFQERMKLELLKKAGEDWTKAMFYQKLIAETLEDWKSKRRLKILEAMLQDEAFARACQTVFNKYLAYCRAWVDGVPFVHPNGYEVSEHGLQVFLRQVENSIGAWNTPEQQLRQGFCKVAETCMQHTIDGEIQYNNTYGLPPSLTQCIEAFVRKSNIDLSRFETKLRNQLANPACRPCRLAHDLRKTGLANIKPGDCALCDLSFITREQAALPYSLERSVLRIRWRLIGKPYFGKEQYCQHCVDHILRAATEIIV